MIFETSYDIGLIPLDLKFANTVPIYNVYQFVCESYVKMQAKRTTCAHQNTLDWIGLYSLVGARSS